MAQANPNDNNNITDTGGLAPHKHHCPHVASAITLPQNASALSMLNITNDDNITCSTNNCNFGECWLCLKCHQIYCGRYGSQHMISHYMYSSSQTEHCMAMGLKDLSFWCYKCEDYINHLSVKKIYQFYEIAHLAKFNQNLPDNLKKKTTFDKKKKTNFMPSIIESDDDQDDKQDDAKQNDDDPTPSASISTSVQLLDDLISSFTKIKVSKTIKTALFYHIDCLKHKPGKNRSHVECPGRCAVSYSMLINYGILDKLSVVTPRECTMDEVILTHKASHYNKIVGNANQYGWYDGDTFYNEYSSRAAKLAVGASIDLICDILNNKYSNGFALIRPPGHHCEYNRPMGFCLFNNVPIAINVALKNNLCSKVLIVDWDVHHGNGSQNLFYDNHNVLYFSVHRYDNGFFYPSTGKIKESGNGYNVNVPLNVTTDQGYSDAEYLLIWKDILLPICSEFKPDIIVISAGFDACIGDPIGGMRVTPPCYGLLTRLLLNVCNCDKVGVVLEGGYNLKTMPRAICCVNYALLKGTKQQNDNYDVIEFEKEFAGFINDGGVDKDYELFNKWRSEYGKDLIDIDYNKYLNDYAKYSKNYQNNITSNIKNSDDFSNMGQCKKTIKKILTEQQKYWKCCSQILKKY